MARDQAPWLRTRTHSASIRWYCVTVRMRRSASFGAALRCARDQGISCRTAEVTGLLHQQPRSTTISLAILQYSSLWWLAATKVSVSVAVIVHARVWLFQRARGQASRRTSTSSGFHENRRTGISRIYTSNMAVGMRDIEPDSGSCSADEAGTGELRVEYTLARDDIGVGPVARVADGLAALAAPAQNGRAFSVSLGSIGKRLSECSHRSRSGFAQEYG